MKNFYLKNLLTIILAFTIANISNVDAQSYSLTYPPNGGNQKASVTQWIGLASVCITYNGPDVHDNKGNNRTGYIWGELIPYGFNDPGGYGTSLSSPWRCGANEITQISFSHNMKVNGKEIKAGVYGLMLAIDSIKPWTWIFSSNYSSWGTYYYNEAEDVLRVDALPEQNEHTEWLSFVFNNRQAYTANAWLLWDNKKIGFRIEVPDYLQLYTDKIKAELTSYAGFDYRNWIRAAQFCLDNKMNFTDALKWIDISMDTVRFNGQLSFRQVAIKTSLLNEMGKQEEAKAIIQAAIGGIKVSSAEVFDYGNKLLNAGSIDLALFIFKLNATKQPVNSFAGYLGLALGHAAAGNKKEAVKYWNLYIKYLPAAQKASLSIYQAEYDRYKNKW